MLGMKFAFGIAIAILFPLMVHYGVSTFVPNPAYPSYESHRSYESGRPVTEEEKREEFREYKEAKKQFAKTLFFVATPLGLLAVLIGPFLRVTAIGTGFVFAGIILLGDSYTYYWDCLQDWMRFTSFFLGLCIFVVLGYKKPFTQS